MNMKAKSIFTSKTFYFGALWVLVSIAGFFGFKEFQPDPNLVKVFELVNGVVIIVLRIVTDKPVKLS